MVNSLLMFQEAEHLVAAVLERVIYVISFKCSELLVCGTV
jgi:hypothetical protein